MRRWRERDIRRDMIADSFDADAGATIERRAACLTRRCYALTLPRSSLFMLKMIRRKMMLAPYDIRAPTDFFLLFLRRDATPLIVAFAFDAYFRRHAAPLRRLRPITRWLRLHYTPRHDITMFIAAEP